MALIRYRPWRGLATWPSFPEVPTRLGQAFEQFFDDSVDGMEWSPSVNIVEHDDELRITAELPGMKRDDVQVEVTEGMLILRGEKKAEAEKRMGNARLMECKYGAFERSFTMPRSVDADQVRAEFADGLLTVRMPKTEKAIGRKVEITGT